MVLLPVVGGRVRRCSRFKEKLAHGEFGPWLKSAEIPNETARRWMRGAESYSLEDLLEVGTVAKALKLLEDPALRAKETGSRASTGGKGNGRRGAAKHVEDGRANAGPGRCGARGLAFRSRTEC